MTAKYPLHEKLKAHLDEARVIGEFLEWLGEKAIYLSAYHKHTKACTVRHEHDYGCTADRCTHPNDGRHFHPGARCTLRCKTVRDTICGCREDELYSVQRSFEELIGAFLDIDPHKLSAEKDAMVEEMRKAQGL